MENFKFEMSVQEMTAIAKEKMSSLIINGLNVNESQIKESLNSFFVKSRFDSKFSSFESNLDWAVENCFRLGLEQALDELNFKEFVASKAKEILSDETFLRDLAEAKVRSSLGLPPK